MKDGCLVDTPAPGVYRPVDSSADVPFAKFYKPNELPPEIELSDDVIQAYGRAMHSLGRLDGFWSEIENPEAVFGLFVYKEAEQSSQVEGTRVTVSDMYKKGEDSKDVREARNYVSAVNYPSLLPRRIRASVLEGGALMWTPGDQLSAVGR